MKFIKKSLPIFIILVLLISVILLINKNFISKSTSSNINQKDTTFLSSKIKSGNLATYYTVEDALKDIDKFQLNTISIPIVIDVSSSNASSMTVNENTKERAINLIKALKEQNKNVHILLEPYPWIENGKIGETEWKPENTNAFFNNWKNSVLKHLINDVANPYKVDALYIGSNFDKIESDEKNWGDIADYVRSQYNGLITYRTNHWNTVKSDSNTQKEFNSKLNNALFSKLDFISVAAYFELSENATNTVEELTSDILSSKINYGNTTRDQNVKEEMERLSQKRSKPIFLGELGFPRTEYAAKNPWEPDNKKLINDQEQANCFEAYRRTFEKQSWILGFSVFAIGVNSESTLYYPSDESTVVIKSWYKH